MAVLGLLGTIGVDLPLDAIETLLTTVFDSALEAYSLILGAVVLWLRKITDSPLAKGFKGFLGVKE